MAPALTEASDPQTFHVAARHSQGRGVGGPHPQTPSACTTSLTPPPATTHHHHHHHHHLPLQYGGLKEPHDCTDAHLVAALTNGTRRSPHLLLPPPDPQGGLACGREEEEEEEAAAAREPPPPPPPPPRLSPARTTMDPQLGPQCQADPAPQSTSTSTSSTISEAPGITTTTTTNMGQDTAAPPQELPINMVPHRSPRPASTQDGELLALIGKDFATMNEIIETLTRLADNPEVLTAFSLPVEAAAVVSAPQIVEPPIVPPVPREERARVLVEELGRRQWLLERRQSRLQRRLRRVTARGLSATVSGQLRDLLSHGHTSLALQREEAAAAVAAAATAIGSTFAATTTTASTGANTTPSTGSIPVTEDGVTPATPSEAGVDSLRADAMKTMSTSALVSLVRRVEASQGLARLAAVTIKSGRHHPPEPAPALPDHYRAEVAAVASEMTAAAHAHTHHDSDATETSSGGESCDELEGFTHTNTTFCPIRERAFYRYHKARAWVASRWTWLQAQIADLEYRILQQHKIYTHVRNSKGPVQIEEGIRWPRGPTLRDPAHLDVHDPALTCLAAPLTPRTTVNGYHSRSEDGSGVDISSRTQGIRAVKRRRLVRAGAGLCAGVRRGGTNTGGGGKIPAVQCKCVPPLTCVLCTRLQGPATAAAPPGPPPPDPCTQPTTERHARVDPTYHPVLSQPSDVSLSERFDGMLKTTDWQRQMLTAKTLPPLSVTRGASSRDPATSSHTDKKKKRDRDRKKEYKKHKKEGKGRITLKLKRSLFTGELVRDGESKRKKAPTQDPLLSMKKTRSEDNDDDGSSVYGSSLHSSPSASPAPLDRSAHRRHASSSSSAAQKNKQSTSSTSYDIDNIVIPYSMAASTRVEKLEYKEIPTPKWRVVPLLPNNIHRHLNINQFEEDISEEAFAARHGRSEELERKKFLQYLHMQVTSRSSRSRRTDSSGTNTPDHPLSPRPPDPASDTISPLATPPTTPLAPSEDSNQSSTVPPSPGAPSLPTSSTSLLNQSLANPGAPFSNPSISSSSLSNPGFSNLSLFNQGFSSSILSLTSSVHSTPTLSLSQSLAASQSLASAASSASQNNASATHPFTNSTTNLLTNQPSFLSSLINNNNTSTSFSGSSLVGGSATPSLAALMGSQRRVRTLSTSSATTTKLRILPPAGDDGSVPDLYGNGILPYEQRVFPLKDSEYTMMTRETTTTATTQQQQQQQQEPVCDMTSQGVVVGGPPASPPSESATTLHHHLDANNHHLESGRSSPMSEVTDSAPEEEDCSNFDGGGGPKWTISGLKDATTGQCVLQVHRN